MIPEGGVVKDKAPVVSNARHLVTDTLGGVLWAGGEQGGANFGESGTGRFGHSIQVFVDGTGFWERFRNHCGLTKYKES